VDYDKYVTNKPTAYPEIRLHENFEEAFILGMLDRLARTGENVAFIEAGSGTGRYMELLARKTTRRVTPATNSLSHYDERLAKTVKLIVGIDFARKMVKATMKRLMEIKMEDGRELYDFLDSEDKLRLIVANIKDVSESKILVGWERGLSRFVCCLFGTLGNITDTDRSTVLMRLREWTGDQGVLLVSVFNRDRFLDLGKQSYWGVSGLIGHPKFDDARGEITSERGFFSHWFTLAELRGMARDDIGLRHTYIVRGDILGIESSIQDSRRALILVASNREMAWLPEVLRGMKDGSLPAGTIEEVACS